MQMEPDATTDGLDHLQRAAREVLGAARSFLDAVEEMVEDRERLSGAAESVAGVVTDLLDRGKSKGTDSPMGGAASWASDTWASSQWSQPNSPSDPSESAANSHGDSADLDAQSSAGEPPAAKPKKVRRIPVD